MNIALIESWLERETSAKGFKLKVFMWDRWLSVAQSSGKPTTIVVTRLWWSLNMFITLS